MTPQQKALIQETWRQVVPIADQAMSAFYDRLFETDPRLRELFANTDMNGQRMKLAQAISAVVDALDRVDGVVADLAALGQRHARYGVTAADYETVGAALLWTLENGLADRWTPEVRAAWTEAYALVAGVMQSAAGDPLRHEPLSAPVG